MNAKARCRNIPRLIYLTRIDFCETHNIQIYISRGPVNVYRDLVFHSKDLLRLY